MTTPETTSQSSSPAVEVPELELLVRLNGNRQMDVERLFEKQLDHRHAMDVKAWRYRVASLVAGLSVFAFLAWFAVRLADQGASVEAVGVIGFGGLPMVALFVTGQVVSRRIK